MLVLCLIVLVPTSPKPRFSCTHPANNTRKLTPSRKHLQATATTVANQAIGSVIAQSSRQKGRVCQCHSKESGPRGKTNWRNIPHEPNEPTTILCKGRKFHWCEKCPHWTTTHTTKTHTGKTTAAKSSHPSPANLPYSKIALIPDPGAWHVNLSERDAMWNDLVDAFLPYLLAFFCGILSHIILGTFGPSTTILLNAIHYGRSCVAPMSWLVVVWLLLSQRPAHLRPPLILSTSHTPFLIGFPPAAPAAAASSQTHHLHHQYPVRLCNAGDFHHCNQALCPTLHNQRAQLTQIEHQLGTLHRCLVRLGRHDCSFFRERHANSASVCIRHTHRSKKKCNPANTNNSCNPGASGPNRPVGSWQPPPGHCRSLQQGIHPLPTHSSSRTLLSRRQSSENNTNEAIFC